MPTIDEFTDSEIKEEYTERFGAPDADLSDFSAADLVHELIERDAMPDPESPDELAEIADLVAEAARTSPHAIRAYGLLFDTYPDLGSLSGRQRLIAGRMQEAA
ncbi:hypothetical protein [Mesorhizobium sp. B2-3-4]|uniref:hypothetical protein n=1 Tax=Mesorhizobium sp. B2-3-4 TaxID=2589959 RepID=UPI00112687B7|nr:hypothetical protein [Mesorhizobium sp. B2-3-4]TPM39606.1 hypothetical protein FJ967_08985 [Mesorhizobium sp. B2-3-4]